MSKILVADDEMIERRVLVKRLRTHCGETCSILEAETDGRSWNSGNGRSPTY